ncbi:MAG: site-2 protease family protein [Anaerolineae bacterium]|nr:site-2 protease family protein [Anaerolineae bacterium]MCO5196758.1 site-2 protease family protein [Anaerolineae bacterium]
MLIMLASGASVQSVVLYFITIVLGFAYHEFAHAIAADRLGDMTPRAAGRMTLNPLKHLDAFGLLMVALIGFGWAVTPVNPYNLRGNWRQSYALVAAAGPLANLIMAALFGIGMRALTFAVPATTLATSPGLQLAYDLCFWGVYTNILLMTFNLIPLPPLDGFTILMGLLPAEMAYRLEPLRRYGSLLIIGMIILLPRITPNLDVFNTLLATSIGFFYPILTGQPFYRFF